MLRKIIMAVCFGYLLLAFMFIALAMLNGAVLDGQNAVAINRADSRVITVLALIGIGATCVLALRMMLDSRELRDLWRRADERRGPTDDGS